MSSDCMDLFHTIFIPGSQLFELKKNKRGEIAAFENPASTLGSIFEKKNKKKRRSKTHLKLFGSTKTVRFIIIRN